MVGIIPYPSPKVKFVVEEQLIKVVAKEDVITILTTSNPYIKVDENAVECSFQSLEVVVQHFSKKE